MIPAAFLIVMLPFLGAIPAVLLRRWRIIELFVALLTCGVVVLVLSQPVNAPINLLGLQIETTAPFNVLGRELQVRNADRVTLLILFLSAAVLFACAWGIAPTSWIYIPVGMGVLSMLSAALLIRPFVFAALAFEAAAAISVLMIQAERTGERSGSGATRYLTVTTLALPFFLGAGYVIRQASAISDPIEQAIAYQPAATLLVLGFALLLGALPLFTWLHGVAKDAPPLTTAFLTTVANSAALLLLLDFFQEYAWFSNDATVLSLLRLMGLLLIVIGGVLAWAQDSFARVLACGLMIDIGSMLLIISSGTPLGVGAVAFGILSRAISLGLFGIGLSILRDHTGGSDLFQVVRGMGFSHRWAAFAIGTGGLSLAGLPGTIGFVARWTSARAIGTFDVNGMAIMVFACVSLTIGLTRGLVRMFDASWREASQRNRNAVTLAPASLITLLVVAGLVLFFGLFPNWVSPLAQVMADSYSFYK